MQIATLVIMTKLGVADERAAQLPPVTQLGMALAGALIVAGGIYLPPICPATCRSGRRSRCSRRQCCCWRSTSSCCRASGLCLGAVLRRSSKWSLLAYVVIAGMLEYVFLATTSAAARSSC